MDNIVPSLRKAVRFFQKPADSLVQMFVKFADQMVVFGDRREQVTLCPVISWRMPYGHSVRGWRIDQEATEQVEHYVMEGIPRDGGLANCKCMRPEG